MRDLGTNDARRLALESDDQVIIFLLEIDLGGTEGTIRMTDAGRDISVSSGLEGTAASYDADAHTVLSTTVPEGQALFGRDLYSVEIEDGDGYWRTHLRTGQDLRVGIAFFNSSSGSITDALLAYTGEVSNFTRGENQGAVTMQITCSGQLARLDNEASVLATDDNQRTRDPTDTCYQYVHRTPDLVWGKA